MIGRNDTTKAERQSGQEDTRFSAPSITLPKGGGAISGMGEKFGANPVTGTGSMTVPLPASPGRGGFGPQLSLAYDSGSGNGPFGFGWSLSLPAITRKTDKGLPQYRDAEESDVYILSGAEDLVPLLERVNEEWRRVPAQPRTVASIIYSVQQYRPRIEGLFARIERWTDQATGQSHWRSISRDNITTLYGKRPDGRIADPSDATHTFSWLIGESYDDKGNAILYEYKAEDSDGVDVFTFAHERNRNPVSRSANRYLKRIQYGNLSPRQPDEDLSQRTDWLFEMVLDYGEHYTEDALSQPATVFLDDQHRAWPVRQDPFSSYRAGFENRTYRLCRRALMFHHIPKELGTADCLVRATEFQYDEGPVASFITSVTQASFVRRADGSYFKKSLPPLEFEYSQVKVSDEVQEIDSDSLDNLPYGVDGSQYQWVDLDGEGVSGILTEQANAWYYKPNLGDGRFGPLQVVASKPSLAALHSGRQQLLDLAGDGQLDVVDFQGPAAGFFERTEEQGWEPFVPFRSLPNLAWNDPNLKFVDLTGDGHADVLVTENDAFTWYTSLAEDGFGTAEKTPQPFDEDAGPRLVFADGTQSIYLADLSGDGLSDLVRIRNSEVCYWPNLGYGRFGAKVTMDNAPTFEAPELFDQRRIRLADIDGSGNVDILYLRGDGVQIYLNQSGNRWSDGESLNAFPAVDDLKAITVSDLLGNGTACLVWSSSLAGDAGGPMRYVDLMGGQKPHLLISSKNNLGAETHVQYGASTKFYLADKAAGTPWITRLPFPVHVIERVDIYDRVSRNRFVTRYAYHHGYFDGIEREFRGFGLVEQWDTEEFASLSTSDAFPDATNLDAASHVPPAYTKTWFHTGAYFGEERISKHFEKDYYREGDLSDADSGLTDRQLEAMLLDDTVLPATLLLLDGTRIDPYALSTKETREACRALKGSILRLEVYGLDGTDEADRPYSVSERNYTIEILQPEGPNRHAVFFAHTRETIDFHYERKLYEVGGQQLADPRVSHAVTLEVDGYGNVLKSAAIGYGRRHPDAALSVPDQLKQSTSLFTYTENQFTNPILLDDAYRTPLPFEARTYELRNLAPASNQPLVTNLFRFDELAGQTQAASDGKHDLPYEDIQSVGAQAGQCWRRLIEQVRTVYRADDLAGPLLLGKLDSLALPFESYKLALTAGLLTQVFGARVTDSMLAGDGGYVHSEGDTNWWIPSGQVFYSANVSDTPAQELTFARQRFFAPYRFRDPFGNTATVGYDAYQLLVQQTADPLGNTASAEHDYRVLAPFRLTDPNGNRAQVAFDALGMVAGTAVMGKVSETKGDLLTGFAPDLTPQQIQDFLVDPKGTAAALLGSTSTRIVYDLERYLTAQQPVFAATLARETHVSDPLPAQGLKIQVNFSYSDGFGREIQKKIQAEPGPLTPGGLAVDPRWVGSGWTIFNNKGKPVRQYEPFFDDTFALRSGNQVGVSPILFYDAAERVVATLHPNHTYEKVVFDSWRQESWDVNDTVLQADPKQDPDVADFFQRLPDVDYLPTWHTQRIGGGLGPEEQQAATKAAAHAGTPAVAHFDTLGRTFLTIADNRFVRASAIVEEKYPTRVVLDIEGNQREVRDAIVQNGDALGRVVMRYGYDMLGNRIHQASMEAGERWMVNDVTGKPIRAWDSRDHRFRPAYDALRRPTDSYLSEGGGAEMVVGRRIYGEGLPNPEAGNLRGKVVEVRDQTGIFTSDDYDFKGNLLGSSGRLAQEYKATLDWSGAVPLEAETYTSRTRYDALNRPTQLIAPHSDQPRAKVNVIQPGYNDANLLESVDAWLNWNAEPGNLLDPATANLHAVTDIDYDAKGQRELIAHGNGAVTTYDYDPLTFRLVNLLTRRNAAGFPNDCPKPPSAGWPGCQLQNLHYTYDPAGNITHIRDDAQQTIYFRNKRVEPSAEYTYDAIYRLIEAMGREHLGQIGSAPIPHSPDDVPRIGLLHRGDGNAMGTYIERYLYDAVGNLLEMQHRGSDPAHAGWERSYAYNEPNLIEPTKQSNRLSSTTIGSSNLPVVEPYTYDAHGNMTAMPHLSLMRADFKDELQATSQQIVNNGEASETTYYVYNAAGQRVRKVTELASGQVKDERIYLGGFEIYRKSGVNPLVRETLHIMDDKQRIALVETRSQGNEAGVPQQLIRYQFGNHLGSASLELDDQAQIISYEEYTPYGSTVYQAVRSQTETPKRYRYTGKERDEETGLCYHGARYYACWLGRWASADPAGMVDGPNLFVYGRCNPTCHNDPTGRQSDKIKAILAEGRRKKAQADEIYGANHTEGYTPEEIGDINRDAKDVPSDLTSPATPEATQAQRVRLGVGRAKREVAQAEAAKNPPLTKAEKWQVAKDSARNWALDKISVSPSTAAVMPPLAANALLTHFVFNRLRAPEPKGNPATFREYQINQDYNYAQNTLTTVELATPFVPTAEITQAGKLAASKAWAAIGRFPVPIIGIGTGGIGFARVGTALATEGEGVWVAGARAPQKFTGAAPSASIYYGLPKSLQGQTADAINTLQRAMQFDQQALQDLTTIYNRKPMTGNLKGWEELSPFGRANPTRLLFKVETVNGRAGIKLMFTNPH